MSKIGITLGSFDLCHAGHVLMFKDCKTVCDFLIVGLQADPSVDRDYKNKPIMTVKERLIILEGIKYIDDIFVYTTEADLYKKLQEIKYDVRILGSDWEGKPYTGHNLPHTPYFHKRSHNYSTSELRQRVYDAERYKNIGADSEHKDFGVGGDPALPRFSNFPRI